MVRHGAGPQGVSGCARRVTAPEEVVLLDEKEKVRNKTDVELRALSTSKDETSGAAEKTLRRTRRHLLCPCLPREALSMLQGGQPPRSRASRALLVSLGAWGHGGHS